MSFEEFGEKAANAISELRKTKTKELILVHHDDADGLCSGAIMKATLEREGYKVKTFCLEKIYPEDIEDLHKNREKNHILFRHRFSSRRFYLRSQLQPQLNHHSGSPRPHALERP
jgi:hypothetical protein